MINSILLKIRKGVETVVHFILVVMTVIICWQVVSRFFFGVTPAWIQELSLLLLVWAGFLGIAIGIQDNTHIYISLFVNKLPQKVQKALALFNRLLTIAFGLFMTYEGAKFAGNMASSTISGLRVPSAAIYMAVPAAGVLVVVYLLAELFGQWKPLEENENGGEE